MVSRAQNVLEFRRVNMHGTKTGPNADPDYEQRYHPGHGGQVGPDGQIDWIGGRYPVKPPYPGAVTKRLYNASTRAHDPDGYLEPHVSDWVSEVAAGAGDVPVEDVTSPLVFMGDEPTGWIESIVARATGKRNSEVTLDDVRRYGRLNIIDADIDGTIYYVGDYSYTEEVQNLYGDRLKFWETNLYDEGDVYTGEGRLVDMPVGPEPNDYITRDSVEVSYSLTGNELVDYIRAVDPDMYERLKERGRLKK